MISKEQIYKQLRICETLKNEIDIQTDIEDVKKALHQSLKFNITFLTELIRLSEKLEVKK